MLIIVLNKRFYCKQIEFISKTAMILEGVKVLELVGLVPSNLCGMFLADFGASVLRICKIDHFSMDCLSNGKQSIALNLKHKSGLKIFRQLCAQSDVLIESFRPGTMEKLGLGPENLLDENPTLIYARISCFGQTGTYAKRSGHDINNIALNGLLSLFGRSNEKPTFPANILSGMAGGGLTSAFAILLALYERKSSGLGQVIDTSMSESAAYLGSWLYRSQKLPLICGRERGRNYFDSGAHFYEVYTTKDDKYMAVGAIERLSYEKLLQGLGLDCEQVLHEEDFQENKMKIAEKFRQRTREEWCVVFEKVDACVTPVLTLEEATKNVHNQERGAFVVNNEEIVPQPAPKFSRTPGKSTGIKNAPAPGSDTKVVLRNLGYSDLAIESFIKESIVQYHEQAKL